MLRSSFDSLPESITLAPPIALPLGSFTVPCRELDEVWATVRLAVTSNCIIDRIANCFVDFMYSPPAQKFLIRTERNGTARGQELK
jgi:hypothetical protein